MNHLQETYRAIKRARHFIGKVPSPLGQIGAISVNLQIALPWLPHRCRQLPLIRSGIKRFQKQYNQQYHDEVERKLLALLEEHRAALLRGQTKVWVNAGWWWESSFNPGDSRETYDLWLRATQQTAHKINEYVDSNHVENDLDVIEFMRWFLSNINCVAVLPMLMGENDKHQIDTECSEFYTRFLLGQKQGRFESPIDRTNLLNEYTVVLAQNHLRTLTD